MNDFIALLKKTNRIKNDEFEVFELKNEYLNNETILEAELVTGKTHQIRAHIAYFGYPIVGDGKYGVSDSKTY